VTEGEVVLVAGALLAAAVAASLVAVRLRLPALLLFLGVGMAAGSDGAGIEFSDYGLARQVGVAALALILFDGGLRAGLAEVRPLLRPALRLAFGATIIVAVVTGMAAIVFFRRPPLEGLLLGSIIASTDSAAVFALLRGSTLSRRLVRTLEGEAGFNDPVALILVIGFSEWILQPGNYGVVDMIVLALRELAIGAVCGYAVGRFGADALARLRLPTSGLYPVASLSVAALAYGAATALQGSAFLAVYLAGLLLADAPIPGRQTIAVFHDGLAWIAQVGLFLALGLLVFPGRLDAVAAEGIVLALVVVLIARPLGTLVATAGQGFSLPERFVLSWAGLRGAAPVVFATFPVASGVPGSTVFFDVIFFAVVVSTLLQGMTFEPLARSFGLTSATPLLPRPLVEFGGAHALGAELVEYPVTPADGVVGRRVRDLVLPLGVAPVVVVRGDEAVPPEPTTRFKAGDVLHLLVRDEVRGRIASLVARLRNPRADGTIADRTAGRGALRGLVSGAWTARDGDPADPELVSGALVVERLRTRRDGRGALVRLEDGRYAVAGATFAAGRADVLHRYAQRRRTRAASGAEGAWWDEVAAALRR
jgi:cell volume regulation protein A